MVNFLFGPPGCGKTTQLSRIIKELLNKYEVNQIMISSFSKTAVAEILSRNFSKEELYDLKKQDTRSLGTLHSICYHANYDTPPIIIETGKYIKDFCQQTGYIIAGGDEEETYSKSDKAYNDYMFCRNRKIPREKWNSDTLIFAKKWEDYKTATGGIDFTDLIEDAYDLPLPWPCIKAMVIDEAQDLTPLEVDLVYKWAKNMELAWFALDDDQTILSFKGSSANHLLELERDHTEILTQSYRVPKKVYDKAVQFIKNVSKRQEKIYLPRNFEGTVEYSDLTFRNVPAIIDRVENELKENNSVMILASCSYMLDEFIREMKNRGIPFGNLYRKNRYDWNPLYYSKGRKPFSKRLYDFLNLHIEGESDTDDVILDFESIINDVKPVEKIVDNADDFFTIEDYKKENEENEIKGLKYWWAWEAYNFLGMTSGILQRGWLKKLKDMDGNKKIDYSWLLQAIESFDTTDKLFNLDVKFLITHLKKQFQTNNVEYVLKILGSYENKKILVEKPPVTIGTIVSVKGSEADVVFLSPDISPAGYRAFKGENIEEQDTIYRTFYVAMTRACKKLILLLPTQPAYVDLRS